MLKVRGLKKRFGDLQVLKGIDLDVHEGDVISILGPSGSGKTTFLRCLEFLERADEGELTLDETSIRFPHADRQRMLKIRRKCGFVFQDYSLFRRLAFYRFGILDYYFDGNLKEYMGLGYE